MTNDEERVFAREEVDDIDEKHEFHDEDDEQYIKDFLEELDSQQQEGRHSNEELCLMIQQGDKSAKDEICRNNYKYVKVVVNHYKDAKGICLTEEDLIQVGLMGLLEAAEKYDVSTGYKFLTYASYYIKGHVLGQINTMGSAVKIEKDAKAIIRKAMKIKDELMEKGTPDDECIKILSKELDISKDKVKEYLMYGYEFSNISSLSNVVGEEGRELGDYIEDDRSENLEDAVSREELKDALINVINKLPGDEKNIILMKSGLKGEEGMSFSDIAKELALPEDRVRLKYERAMRMLKNPEVKKMLKDYL